jgi:flagellar basal-body rod modification protein FlgD
MDIAGTTSATQALTQAQTTNKTLGKEEFLKLFVTQLKAQDPLNPMDSTGFTSQLAQFSSLEQLTNISSGITNLMSFQSSLQNTMTTSLIGKKVKVDGNVVNLNGQADLRYGLAANAAKVSVSIFDMNGTLVRQQDIAGQTGGERVYTWDGRNQNGAAAPAGQYLFRVDAVDSAGQSITASPLAYGTVTGVAYENNMTYLNLDNGMRVQLGDIREIGGA